MSKKIGREAIETIIPGLLDLEQTIAREPGRRMDWAAHFRPHFSSLAASASISRVISAMRSIGKGATTARIFCCDRPQSAHTIRPQCIDEDRRGAVLSAAANSSPGFAIADDPLLVIRIDPTHGKFS